ncbi:MAG TPA: sigma-70 family RNA polymerase sigma factor [Polyangiales bacterium]|nr:sigma-70 family RNA polymerase sigma factor [Polyangiales bacterium]
MREGLTVHRATKVYASRTGLDMLAHAARHAPILSSEQELALAQRARQRDEAALAQLLDSHLRLVLAIAHDFAVYGLPFEELVSEGLLGLVEAARRFEPERGARLGVYAAFWIRAYMRRYTISYRRIVRAPSSRHGRKLLAKLRTTQRALAQASFDAPRAEDVARVLGVTVRDVEEMEAALYSRDVSCNADDGRGVDVPSDAPSPELMLASAEEQSHSVSALQRGMCALTARERSILERRYFSDEGSSFASIGRELGLSRERVRQIEHRAQDKLRDAMAHA